MVIAAHPDDPEFSSGGTVARWVRGGARAIYVIVTDGSKGSSDPTMTGERMEQIRKSEQLAAARVLGVSEVVFLGYPDGGVYNTPRLRRDLVRQIRLHRPEVVVTHDPTTRFASYSNRVRINHPDHRAVGDTALDAIFPLARDRLNFSEQELEGLAPHKVLDIFMFSSNEPNEWVDIAETIEQKVAALWEHRSQIGDPQQLASHVHNLAREMAGPTPYTYAERFRRITLSD